MAVLMVNVRKVRVPMAQGLMTVLVKVGLTALPVVRKYAVPRPSHLP